MRLIAKEIGIHILYNDNYEKLLGMYCVFRGQRFITLNSRLDDIWLPMVTAHEIGHDQLHRELLTGPFTEYVLFPQRDITEYEANACASHLLLDNEDVYESLREGKDIQTIAREENVDLNLLLIKLQEMRALGYPLKPGDSADSTFFRKIYAGKECDPHVC